MFLVPWQMCEMDVSCLECVWGAVMPPPTAMTRKELGHGEVEDLANPHLPSGPEDRAGMRE